jgi:hypothetical protein
VRVEIVKEVPIKIDLSKNRPERETEDKAVECTIGPS